MKILIDSLLALFLLSITIISCKNSPEENTDTVLLKQTPSGVFGNVHFNFPVLTEEAKIEVTHWGAFEDFETEAKTINGNTIEELQIRTSQLVFHIDSLTKNIPDTLNTRAIYSRVMVAKTRSKLLEQEVNKSRIDSVRLQSYFEELNISVTNLIVQINEKFQKDAIDLQRVTNEKQELKKQQRFLDSVYQIELQDNKNNNP